MKFIEFIQNEELLEMQSEKKKVENDIRSFRDSILEHLTKVIKYKTNRDTRKHIADIYDNWLITIAHYKIKGNIQLSQQQYVKLLTLDNETYLNKILNDKFKQKYYTYIEARTDDDTADIVLKMIEDIQYLLQNKYKENEIINFFHLFDGVLKGDYPVNLDIEISKRS